MKVLKYIGGELGDTVYVQESIGLNDSLSMPESIVFFIEDLGLGDLFFSLIEEFITEDLGLDDTHLIILSEEILESIGLGDILYQYDRAEVIEQLGLNSIFSESMIMYIEIEENIGFVDGGYGYLVMNYNLRWRTRTKKSTYGFGLAPFGDQTSYGDGDVIDEIKEFKVKVIRINDSSVLRTDTISIDNKSFPDASAKYEYTSSMNISDNGYYEPNLRFEVYQININDTWSPAKYLDITASLNKGDFI